MGNPRAAPRQGDVNSGASPSNHSRQVVRQQALGEHARMCVCVRACERVCGLLTALVSINRNAPTNGNTDIINQEDKIRKGLCVSVCVCVSCVCVCVSWCSVLGERAEKGQNCRNKKCTRRKSDRKQNRIRTRERGRERERERGREREREHRGPIRQSNHDSLRFHYASAYFKDSNS